MRQVSQCHRSFAEKGSKNGLLENGLLGMIPRCFFPLIFITGFPFFANHRLVHRDAAGCFPMGDADTNQGTDDQSQQDPHDKHVSFLLSVPSYFIINGEETGKRSVSRNVDLRNDLVQYVCEVDFLGLMGPQVSLLNMAEVK